MKFSIITPSSNSSRHIRETIQSVISQQGDFTIEYFVIDNCSTDGTIEIVMEFKQRVESDSFPLACKGIDLSIISSPDNGMYDAINKGFGKATGDVFGWINADDIYLPGAFATIAKIFSTYNEIHWIKGITSYITNESLIWQEGRCLLYAQQWIKRGIYGRDDYFIQQDSVFWRAWLWEKCGGIDAKFRRAGDYYLWVRFAEWVPLVSVRSLLSCFRSVTGQLSQDVSAYMMEVKAFSPGNDILSQKVRLFHLFEKWLVGLLKPYLFRLIFGRVNFSVLLISAEGKLTKKEGEYYELLRYL